MQLEFRRRDVACAHCSKVLRPWHWRFCSEDCYRDGHQSALVTRFWAKVDKSGDCWLWTATKFPTGYGNFGVSVGHMDYAHRVSYQLAFGPIPPGASILHSCDNRACVRPAHLRAGSQLENIQDAIKRGRFRPIPDASRRQPTASERARGERIGTSRLTPDIVTEIRRLYAVGDVSQKSLGIRFGVHQGTISNVVRRAQWQHL